MKKLTLIIAIVFSGMLFMEGCSKDDTINPAKHTKHVKTVIMQRDNDNTYSSIEYLYDNNWNIVRVEVYREGKLHDKDIYSRTGNILTIDRTEYSLGDTYKNKYLYRFSDEKIEFLRIRKNGDTIVGNYYELDSKGRVSGKAYGSGYEKLIWENNNVVKLIEFHEDWTQKREYDFDYHSDIRNPFQGIFSPHYFFSYWQYPTMSNNFLSKSKDDDVTFTILESHENYPLSVFRHEGDYSELVEFIYY